MFDTCSHVVDLGDFVIEWLFNVPVTLNVPLNLTKTFHSLHVLLNVLIFVVKFVVGEELHEVTHFKHVKIEVRQLRPSKVVFVSEELDNGSNFGLCGLGKSLGVGSDVTGSCDCGLYVFELRIEHVNLSLLFVVFSKQFRGVLGCEVDHNGRGVSEFGFAVNHVGNVWEVKAKGVLNLRPALDGEIWRVALFIKTVLVRVFNVLKQVADWLSKTSNFPVSNHNWLVFRILLLPVCGWVFDLFFESLSHGCSHHTVAFLLKFARLFESLALDVCFFTCAAAHFIFYSN